MAGLNTHLSVCAQSGYRILFMKIRFTPLDIMLVELFLHLSEEDERVGERRVVKVTIADRGSSSGGGTEVDLTAPVALCVEFCVNYVTSLLSDYDSGMSNSVGLNPTRSRMSPCTDGVLD